VLQVLVATSTLAWGVNTPAHLVIIKGTEYFDAPTKRCAASCGHTHTSRLFPPAQLQNGEHLQYSPGQGPCWAAHRCRCQTFKAQQRNLAAAVRNITRRAAGTSTTPSRTCSR
jgi:hypothetical protein